jgi:hypothetical protein
MARALNSEQRDESDRIERRLLEPARPSAARRGPHASRLRGWCCDKNPSNASGAGSSISRLARSAGVMPNDPIDLNIKSDVRTKTLIAGCDFSPPESVTIATAPSRASPYAFWLSAKARQ